MTQFEDEEIERTLRVLGGAKSPEGLDGRVLQRLAERRVEVAATGWATGVMGWHLVWTGAMVTMVLVAALWMLRGHAGGGVAGVRHVPVVRVPAVVGPAVVGPAVVGPAVEAGRVVRVDVARVDVARPAGVEGKAAVSAEVGRSYPAPEAPLTREERMLVRIAQRGEAVEVATLDRQVWARGDEEEKAAVAAFFVKPKPKLDGNAPLEVILAAGKAEESGSTGDDGRGADMARE